MASRTTSVLDGMAWRHRTPSCAALDWRFAVRTNDDLLGGELARILRSLESAVDDPTWYSIVRTEHGVSTRFRLYRGDLRLLDCDDAVRVLRHVLWDVNQQAFRRTAGALLVHAAAATHGGQALLLPASSGAGKSTLVAGLVERGLGYLTDEAAAVDPDSALVAPYPKAISIKVGSQAALARLRPDSPAVLSPSGTPWEVAPNDVRRGAVAAAAPLRWVVIPRHVDEGVTVLEPLPRALALAEVVAQCAAPRPLGRAGFAQLAQLLRHASCYSLVSTDLERACDALLEMLEADR